MVKALSKRVDVSSARISAGGTCLRPARQPVYRRHELWTGFSTERGNLCLGREGGHRGGATRSSEEAPLMGGGAKGSRYPVREEASTGMTGRNVAATNKPFPITKRMVWEAYREVRGKGKAAGVDRQSLEDFAGDLERNLYRLWNRMASGSYSPPPVRQVEIPKGNGGTRQLGIPTVADRISQMVVKRFLEPALDPHFDADSYGYRPGKSAHDAAGGAPGCAGAA
jgi:hypothetical protein